MNRIVCIFIALSIAVLLLTGCGKAEKQNQYEGESYYDITNGEVVEIDDPNALPVVIGNDTDAEEAGDPSKEKDLSDPGEHMPGEDPWELPIS